MTRIVRPLALLTPLTLAAAVHAATVQWNLDANSAWTTGTNWLNSGTPNTPPALGDDVVFAAVNLSGPIAITSVNSSTDFATLTFNANADQSVSFDANINLDSSLTYNLGTATHTLQGLIRDNATFTITNNSGVNQNITYSTSDTGAPTFLITQSSGSRVTFTSSTNGLSSGSKISGNLVMQGGTVQMTGVGRVLDIGSVVMTSNAVLDLAGGDALGSSNYLSRLGGTTSSIADDGTGTITNTDATTTRTLNLRGSSDAWGGAVSANLGINRGRGGFADSGSTTLTGTLTYTGPTAVNTGTLFINTTHTGGGSYTVNGRTNNPGVTPGILGGNGTINVGANTITIGDNDLDNTGILAPGSAANTIGTLNTTAATLAFNADGVLQVNLNSVTSNTTDKVVHTGAVTINAASVLELPTLAAFAAATFFNGTTYSILTHTGALTGSFIVEAGAASLLAANNYEVRYDPNVVVLAVIPEPASLALAMAGRLLILPRRTRA